MPVDPRARRFLDTLAAMNPPSALALSVEERRAGLAHLLSFSGAPQAVAAGDRFELPGPAGSLAVRAYTPSGADAGERLPGMVYFHGGGLVAGTLDTHDPICRSLSNASGCRVLSVDYRLAPEHPFPAAVADGCAATAWIAGHAEELCIDPRRIGVAGGAPGGGPPAAVVRPAHPPRGAAPRIPVPFVPDPGFWRGE